MDGEVAYSSQFNQPKRKIETLNPTDMAIGAPFLPLPRSFFKVDPRLSVAQRLPTPEEIAKTVHDRAKFRVGDYNDPYVDDVLRAFRLLEGKNFYLEIGSLIAGTLPIRRPCLTAMPF
jgi:hypothetical protein